MDAYLEIYESPASKKIRAHRLSCFFKFVENKSICTITHDEFMKYFLHLKAKDYTLATKQNMWLILRSFVEFIQESTSTFINFPRKFAKWGNNNKHKKDTASTIMDKAYIDMLLEKAKPLDYKKYIQILLLRDTGMNISELVTIKTTTMDDGKVLSLGVNLQDRFVITGIDPGAQKHARTGPILYFFSKETQRELARYLNARSKVDTSNPYLFTSNGKLQHEQTRNIELFVSQIRGDKPITPHAFRRTINTLRKNMFNCPLEDREFLLNQKVSMNSEHYTKLSIAERLALYDRYYPF